jgi:hypothetical protein
MLWIGACHDEPKPRRIPTLRNLWPNQDGRVWNYDATVMGWLRASLPPEVIFQNPGDVPAAPSLREVVGLLEAEIEGTPFESENTLYTLRFSGTTSTESGATGQSLVATMGNEPVEAQTAAAGAFVDVFFARLAVARPDLRARIEERIGRPVVAGLAQPMFLRGGAWERTDEWIGMYGDLDSELAWLYLDADLDVGHEFTFQLAPSLVDDAFLHVLVHRRVSVETDAGKYENALEVIYEIDFGVSELVDDSGTAIGYLRIFDIARIAYAVDVGPVDCTERLFYVVGRDRAIGPRLSIELPLQSARRPPR